MSKKAKKETTPQPEAQQVQVQELTTEQEINALRNAHTFFGNFDSVPGFAAAQWGQALDAIAVVANSLIKKAGLLDAPANDADKSQSAN